MNRKGGHWPVIEVHAAFSKSDNETPVREGLSEALLISSVRIGCLAFLVYWCLLLARPFLTIIAWSIIFAVALYPVFVWTASKLGGHRALAAAGLTIVSLLVILGPATWLGLSLIETLRFLIEQLGDGSISVPPPSDSVKNWPVIGEKAYEIWYLASANLKELLINTAPHLKSYGSKLLGVVGNTGLNIIKFLAAVVVSGFLFIPGPALAQSARSLLQFVAAKRGDEFIDLAGNTIRNVSRGIIGISVLQALLAGIGLMAAGVPAAGLLSFLVLFFGIIQFPSLILFPLIIWSWITMETTAALLFSAYMLPVGLIDNVLRPLVIAKGLNVPVPVLLVGVIGGTLAHGIIGLFVGPVVLSVAWQLFMTLMTDTKSELASVRSVCHPEQIPSAERRSGVEAQPK